MGYLNKLHPIDFPLYPAHRGKHDLQRWFSRWEREIQGHIVGRPERVCTGKLRTGLREIQEDTVAGMLL
jgi:hypothetical protein